MFLVEGLHFLTQISHLNHQSISTMNTLGGSNYGMIMSPRITSPMHPGGGGRGGQTPARTGGGGGGRGGGRGGHNVRRDRDLIGSTIKITGGPFKGISTIFSITLSLLPFSLKL